MTLTSIGRTVAATAAVGLLTSVMASAGVVRHVGPMSQSARPTFAGGTITHNTSCPSQYYACAEISKSSPYQATWCVSTSGNCSSGLVGEWNWTATVTKVKSGKATKKVKATWSPDPGNPSTVTITTKLSKSSKGKIAYAVTLSTCEVTNPSSCFSNFVTYGISIL